MTTKDAIEKLIQTMEKYGNYKQGSEQINPVNGKRYRYDHYEWAQNTPYWLQKLFIAAKKEVEPFDKNMRNFSYEGKENWFGFGINLPLFKGEQCKESGMNKLVILS